MVKYIYYFENGIHIKYNRRADSMEIKDLESTMGELMYEEFEIEYPDMIKVEFRSGKTKVVFFEEYKKYRFHPETETIIDYGTGEVIYYRRR